MIISGFVRGGKAIADALEKISIESKKAFGEAVSESVLQIHDSAIQSIQAHQSSGRTYKRGNISHVASQPGYAPNTDTGTLVKSIGFNVYPETLSGEVGTNLKYGAYLEFGTTTIDARPWLLPAVRNTEEKVREIFRSIKIGMSGRAA